MSDVERTEVHETTWIGNLSDDVVVAAIQKLICGEAGVSPYERGLSFDLRPDPDGGHRFVLKKDELWYQKQVDGQDGAA